MKYIYIVRKEEFDLKLYNYSNNKSKRYLLEASKTGSNAVEYVADFCNKDEITKSLLVVYLLRHDLIRSQIIDYVRNGDKLRASLKFVFNNVIRDTSAITSALEWQGVYAPDLLGVDQGDTFDHLVNQARMEGKLVKRMWLWPRNMKVVIPDGASFKHIVRKYLSSLDKSSKFKHLLVGFLCRFDKDVSVDDSDNFIEPSERFDSPDKSEKAITKTKPTAVGIGQPYSSSQPYDATSLNGIDDIPKHETVKRTGYGYHDLCNPPKGLKPGMAIMADHYIGEEAEEFPVVYFDGEIVSNREWYHNELLDATLKDLITHGGHGRSGDEWRNIRSQALSIGEGDLFDGLSQLGFAICKACYYPNEENSSTGIVIIMEYLKRNTIKEVSKALRQEFGVPVYRFPIDVAEEKKAIADLGEGEFPLFYESLRYRNRYYTDFDILIRVS